MPHVNYSRRQIVQHLATLGVLSVLPFSALAQIITREPPRSPFNSRSTAEEVTQGIDLSGKTIAITGANSGLGHETMRVLALARPRRCPSTLPTGNLSCAAPRAFAA
jgi:hypothetical protein